MLRISKWIERLENSIETVYKRLKGKKIKYFLIMLGAMYLYGALINSIKNGISKTFGNSAEQEMPLLEWSFLKNMFALFTPTGLVITFVIVLMYMLITKRGYGWVTGYRTIKDKERNIEILPEGTHGTSSWLERKDMSDVFEVNYMEKIQTPLLGRLETDEYVGIKDIRGLNKNIIVYGAPGTGKSRGFVQPFLLQAIKRRESCILIDPKAEFFEAFSAHFKIEGYVVKAFNLLDMESSDAWNCLNDTYMDRNMVQAVAEVIIRNTSNADEKQDFWEKSEKNLLVALMLFVQSLTNPKTGELLPIEERSLGKIYRLMSTTSFNNLDAMFNTLPLAHPARAPYGIFKQAAKQLWGNIAIGLGSRLNIFQNELVDKITKHNEIDLELPGKQPCAYFCIISDQESSLEFLSSMFFSVLFMKLSDYARHCENRRLPVEVNICLDEFPNIGKILDFKKTISTARSRGINCQVIVQSIAQLADRYPRTEWQELVGDCDTQLFLGCNDQMTAEFISKQCGDMTVRVNNTSIPVSSMFSPVSRSYNHIKQSAGRPLIMPDEVRRLQKEESIVLVRGKKPLKLNKIDPTEHPAHSKLIQTKVTDYIPEWRTNEEKKKSESHEQREKPDRKVSKGKVFKNDSVENSVGQESLFEHIFEGYKEVGNEGLAGGIKDEGELFLEQEETDLKPDFLSRGINCREISEVSAEDI